MEEFEPFFSIFLCQSGLDYFGMAAGGSPYALKNIAEGFGLGAKQAMTVLKDFRAAEQERQKGMFEIERAQRLEVLGRNKEAEESYQKGQERHDKARDRRMAAVSTLTGKLASAEQTAAYKQVGMAQAAAQHKATEENRKMRQAEVERENRLRDIDRAVKSGPVFMQYQAKLKSGMPMDANEENQWAVRLANEQKAIERRVNASGNYGGIKFLGFE